LKIQSATTLARKAFYAYKLIPTEESKKELLSLRSTEPMLYNVLNKYNKLTYEELSKKFDDSQSKINETVYKLINNNDIILLIAMPLLLQTLLYIQRKKESILKSIIQRQDHYIKEERPQKN